MGPSFFFYSNHIIEMLGNSEKIIFERLHKQFFWKRLIMSDKVTDVVHGLRG